MISIESGIAINLKQGSEDPSIVCRREFAPTVTTANPRPRISQLSAQQSLPLELPMNSTESRMVTELISHSLRPEIVRRELPETNVTMSGSVESFSSLMFRSSAEKKEIFGVCQKKF
jgi:hypothetical protein